MINGRRERWERSAGPHFLGEEVLGRAPAKVVEHRQDDVLLDAPQPHADLGLLHGARPAQLFAAAVVCDHETCVAHSDQTVVQT